MSWEDVFDPDIVQAVKALDVAIAAQGGTLYVRFEVDGVVFEMGEPPHEVGYTHVGETKIDVRPMVAEKALVVMEDWGVRHDDLLNARTFGDFERIREGIVRDE